MDLTLITAVVGVATGVTGATLGVINVWVNIRRDRVRLRVTLAEIWRQFPPFGDRRAFSLEVINLSEFPVVITEAGFVLTERRTAPLNDIPQFIEPNGPLPLRIEPRTKYVKLLPGSQVLNWKYIKRPYATTECGVTKRGKRIHRKRIYGAGG